MMTSAFPNYVKTPRATVEKSGGVDVSVPGYRPEGGLTVWDEYMKAALAGMSPSGFIDAMANPNGAAKQLANFVDALTTQRERRQ